MQAKRFDHISKLVHFQPRKPPNTNRVTPSEHFSTDVPAIDQVWNGLPRRSLTVVRGKIEACRNIATMIAGNVSQKYLPVVDDQGSFVPVEGGVVGYFSLGASSEQIATLVMSQQTGIASSRITRGDISEIEFEKLVAYSSLMQKMPLFINQAGFSSISDLVLESLKMKIKNGLDVLVVDSVENIKETEIGTSAQILKNLAVAENLSVLITTNSSEVEFACDYIIDVQEDIKMVARNAATLPSDDETEQSEESNRDFLKLALSEDLLGDEAEATVYPEEVVEALGGQKLLNLEEYAEFDLFKLALLGLPKASVLEFWKQGWDPSDWPLVPSAELLAALPDSHRLTPSESDLVICITRLNILANRVFKTKVDVLTWMRSAKHDELNSVTPAHAATLCLGRNLVEKILRRNLFGNIR